MTTTTPGRPSSSVLHPHHASPCNLNLRLRFPPTNSLTVSSKCLCSPTTHPGSFRCAYHRRLEKEKKIGTLTCTRSGCGNVGLNLRKLALINSLARFRGVEAGRFRRGLVASLVKPSVFDFRRRPEFRPRPSRFYAMHRDVQD